MNLSGFLPSPFLKWFRVSYKETALLFILFMRFLSPRKFSCSSESLLSHIFLHLCMFAGFSTLFATLYLLFFAQSTVSLQKGKTPRSEYSVYDTKSDSEVPIMLEIWGMLSTPSLPSLPGSLWPGVVVPDRFQSMD